MDNTPIFDPQASLNALLDSRRQKQEDESLIREQVKKNMAKAVDEVMPGVENIYERIFEVLGSDDFLVAHSTALNEGLEAQFLEKMRQDIHRELSATKPKGVVVGENFDFSMVVLRRMAHDLLAGPLKKAPDNGSDLQSHYKKSWRISKALEDVAKTWNLGSSEDPPTVEWDAEVLKALTGGDGRVDWLDLPIARANEQANTAFARGRHKEIELFKSLEGALKESKDLLLDLQVRGLVPPLSRALDSLREGQGAPKVHIAPPGRF